jgi:hypothetical protein
MSREEAVCRAWRGGTQGPVSLLCVQRAVRAEVVIKITACPDIPLIIAGKPNSVI